MCKHRREIADESGSHVRPESDYGSIVSAGSTLRRRDT